MPVRRVRSTGLRLRRALGLTADQVGAFRDVGAYVAAVEAGTVDGEELQARNAVIRFHLCELGEQERRALRRMLRRGQDRRRRARLAAVERETHTREEIGERDHWECGHCLTPVPREADPRDPRAPQVDHITAIAEGGADKRANVAHRRPRTAWAGISGSIRTPREPDAPRTTAAAAARRGRPARRWPSRVRSGPCHRWRWLRS